MNFLFLGSLRKQPPREILSLDQSWNEATRSRNQAMGPHFLGDRASLGSIVENRREVFRMPLFVKARSFLRNLFLSRRVDADLDQEVHAHLEMLIAENIRAGMPPHEAQRAARIELGGVEQVKEQVRASRTGAFLDS